MSNATSAHAVAFGLRRARGRILTPNPNEVSMAKRKWVDPGAWTNTVDGHAKYKAARAEAHAKARAIGCDVGIERNDLFKSFHVFLLPAPAHRSGHELRCEVVRPSDPIVEVSP